VPHRSAEGSALVRDRVGRFAADSGIPHVYTTGNHDLRPGFTAALGTGHLDARGTDVGRLLPGLDDERAAVSTVGGLRVVTLDSLVPGHAYGAVGTAQLASAANAGRAASRMNSRLSMG
jgi:3',5'-cyclic AMP phosphodiesterase CpdA